MWDSISYSDIIISLFNLHFLTYPQLHIRHIIINAKKPPFGRFFIKRGKKVAFQKLASNGDSGIGKKFNTSIGFCKGDKRN